MISKLPLVLAYAAALASAGPIVMPRVVDKLNQEAFEEAHQRDDTATRAFEGVQIKTPSGQCLTVDPLSGDFRANLNPVQVAACGGDGQQWDVLTSGKHNNKAGQVLIVNTLTQACLSFDPRRDPSSQVHMFSCGGRADGSGEVADSQLFAFAGVAGPIQFQPRNGGGQQCVSIAGGSLVIAACNRNDAKQFYTFVGDGVGGGNSSEGSEAATTTTEAATTEIAATDIAVTEIATTEEAATETAAEETAAEETAAEETAAEETEVAETTANNICAATTTVIMTVTVSPDSSASSDAANTALTTVSETEAPIPATTEAPPETTAQPPIDLGGIPTVNPTEPVPVSGAGGVLRPTDVAEAHVRDDTATRALTAVSIRAPNGQCLFIDPTAGDFRENLIPVQLVPCSGAPNEKFDIITAGKHNNGRDGGALIVSSLTNGCISFDGRRAPDDNVTLFSCGGRANGEGETNSGQLVKFVAGSTQISLRPISEGGKTCIVAGDGRVVGKGCANDGADVFTIVQ